MAIIAIKSDKSYKLSDPRFFGNEYIVDTGRQFEGYKQGDLICYIYPFFDVPLRLEIAIRADGSLAFRKWDWRLGDNGYLHTDEKPERLCKNSYEKPFVPTEAQIDTVNGLFSGRIRFEGLKLPVGGTVQDICPIDVKREEELIGKTIYLNR